MNKEMKKFFNKLSKSKNPGVTFAKHTDGNIYCSEELDSINIPKGYVIEDNNVYKEGLKIGEIYQSDSMGDVDVYDDEDLLDEKEEIEETEEKKEEKEETKEKKHPIINFFMGIGFGVKDFFTKKKDIKKDSTTKEKESNEAVNEEKTDKKVSIINKIKLGFKSIGKKPSVDVYEQASKVDINNVEVEEVENEKPLKLKDRIKLAFDKFLEKDYVVKKQDEITEEKEENETEENSYENRYKDILGIHDHIYSLIEDNDLDRFVDRFDKLSIDLADLKSKLDSKETIDESLISLLEDGYIDLLEDVEDYLHANEEFDEIDEVDKKTIVDKLDKVSKLIYEIDNNITNESDLSTDSYKAEYQRYFNRLADNKKVNVYEIDELIEALENLKNNLRSNIVDSEDKKEIVVVKEKEDSTYDLDPELIKTIYETSSYDEISEDIHKYEKELASLKLKLLLLKKTNNSLVRDEIINVEKSILIAETELEACKLRLTIYGNMCEKVLDEEIANENKADEQVALESLHERADYFDFWQNSDESKMSSLQSKTDEEIKEFYSMAGNNSIARDYINMLLMENPNKTAETSMTKELTKMKVNELKEIAVEKNIALDSNMKKVDIINAIVENELKEKSRKLVLTK